MVQRYNAVNLIFKGAEAKAERGDFAAAWGLFEIGNNLILLLQKKVSVDDFLEHYSGEQMEPVNVKHTIKMLKRIVDGQTDDIY